MLYLLLLLVLMCCAFLKELWMRWHYDLHKIPTPPKLPLLGHALQLKKGNKTYAINVWLQEWRAKLGFPKLMRLCVAGGTTVVVTDLELVRKICQPTSNTLPRQGATYRHFHRLFMRNDPTPSSFTTPETTPYVKVIRRSYAESFTSVGMRNIFKKQIKVLNKGVCYLKERKHEDKIDIQEFFSRLILDSIGKTLFDIDLGGLDNSKPLCRLLLDCEYHIRSITINPLLALQTKFFPSTKVAQKINQDFHDIFKDWTKIANEVVNRGEPDENDISLTANFRRARMPGTNGPLPFNLLRGELATAIVGGFDTTSHQLAWIFALLATNPLVVDKILDELRAHDLYGEGAKEFKFDDLSELKYLTAVVKEGMRRIHIMVFVGG
eukprot:g342.t1